MKRVFLLEDLPQVAEHLQGLLAREPEITVLGVEADPERAIARVASDRPEVVFLDALLGTKDRSDPLLLAKRFRAASPATRVVVVTVPQRPVAAGADAAIDAVLVLPGGANELAAALGPRAEAAARAGQVVVIYSPKGGTGKTTIAVNLACALRRDGRTVALMDGVMQFGALRHVLPVPPEARSIIDLPAGPAMRGALPGVLWEGPGGVHVLLAPERPEQADLLQASEIANAMGLLAADHDFVIVDAPNRLADDTLAIFDAATTIIVVSTYMDVTVQNARSAVETFAALGYRGQKPLLVVVNQGDNGPSMTRAALEQALGLPVVAELPSDWKTVSRSLNERQPFVLSSPTTAVAKAVGLLATTLVAQQRAR